MAPREGEPEGPVMVNGFPRRNRVDLFTPAEVAIRNAVFVVESVGAHPRLTDAVVLLAQAQAAVADGVEALGLDRCDACNGEGVVETGDYPDAGGHHPTARCPACAPSAAPSSGGEVTGAVRLLAAERERQQSVEGWTEEHDDEHTDEALAIVASQYARPEHLRETRSVLSPPRYSVPVPWPVGWSHNWWKPTPDDRVRELVKAGALIVAEIERLLRARSGGGA